MKIVGLVLAVIVFVLGVYGLVADNFASMPYLELFVGLMFLVLGLIQFRENRKAFAILLLAVSGFSLFVSIVGFM